MATKMNMNGKYTSSPFQLLYISKILKQTFVHGKSQQETAPKIRKKSVFPLAKVPKLTLHIHKVWITPDESTYPLVQSCQT